MLSAPPAPVWTTELPIPALDRRDVVELTVPAGQVRFQWIGGVPGTPVAHVLVPRDLITLTAEELT